MPKKVNAFSGCKFETKPNQTGHLAAHSEIETTGLSNPREVITKMSTFQKINCDYVPCTRHCIKTTQKMKGGKFPYEGIYDAQETLNCTKQEMGEKHAKFTP